ncbi:MAG: hypothetical protein EOM05_08690 [Clostridia bacterium]|nr:hypothetical protein [Clostridia bacterium]
MPDLTHRDDIDLYVRDNIEEINQNISNFKKSYCPRATYDETDIKNHLKSKLISEIETSRSTIMQRFEDYNFVKARIKDIATELIYYAPDVEKVIEDSIYSELKDSTDHVALSNSIINCIYEHGHLNQGKRSFINRSIRVLTGKVLFLLLQKGFLLNINNVESGVMTANAGDSAQFLFLSRAILAGYNCSNVDVRSSRYDAIIDYRGRLFKVQVKGISNTTVSFKDRDRGGRGIDTHNPRNQGQRITAADCDIYAAVDKQCGICYIIPMRDIDPLPDAEIRSVDVSRLERYRENWTVIDELYNDM